MQKKLWCTNELGMTYRKKGRGGCRSEDQALSTGNL